MLELAHRSMLIGWIEDPVDMPRAAATGCFTGASEHDPRLCMLYKSKYKMTHQPSHNQFSSCSVMYLSMGDIPLRFTSQQ